LSDRGIELTTHPGPRQRGVGDQCDAFHRVKSSTTARLRKRRLSVSVSLRKSSDQRWFGPCGNAIGARVPRALLRPPRRRTCSRSSAYSEPCELAASIDAEAGHRPRNHTRVGANLRHSPKCPPLVIAIERFSAYGMWVSAPSLVVSPQAYRSCLNFCKN
jgi:hypothetical protein